MLESRESAPCEAVSSVLALALELTWMYLSPRAMIWEEMWAVENMI